MIVFMDATHTKEGQKTVGRDRKILICVSVSQGAGFWPQLCSAKKTNRATATATTGSGPRPGSATTTITSKLHTAIIYCTARNCTQTWETWLHQPTQERRKNMGATRPHWCHHCELTMWDWEILTGTTLTMNFTEGPSPASVTAVVQHSQSSSDWRPADPNTNVVSTWEAHLRSSFLNGLKPELSNMVKHTCITWDACTLNTRCAWWKDSSRNRKEEGREKKRGITSSNIDNVPEPRQRTRRRPWQRWVQRWIQRWSGRQIPNNRSRHLLPLWWGRTLGKRSPQEEPGSTGRLMDGGSTGGGGICILTTPLHDESQLTHQTGDCTTHTHTYTHSATCNEEQLTPLTSEQHDMIQFAIEYIEKPNKPKVRTHYAYCE